MSRLRWAAAVLAGGLGLIAGCASLRDHPWFGRGRAAPANCCETPTAPIAEGPILDGGPPAVPPPGVEIQQPATNGNLRPIPRPDAQPVPAPPASRRVPGLISDRWKD
jgi:hypothetical protein